MDIGILGAGRVGLVLARRAQAAGHHVLVAASGDPRLIETDVSVAAPGARAVWAHEAASASVVLLAVPITKARSLPADALAGRIVVDTMNYWWETDGSRPDLADPTTSTSETVASWLPGAKVVKALNHASVWELENLGRPAGDPERRGIAVAGDDADAVTTVCELVDSLGFDPVRAGALAEGVRFEPGTEAFGADATTEDLRDMLDRFWDSQKGRVVARARAASAPAASAPPADPPQN